MVKLVLQKTEEPEIKLPTSAGSSKKQEFQKSMYFCFIDYAKVFAYVDHNKLWKILKEMGISDHLTCLLRNCMQVKKQLLELDMEKWTGSKIGKGVSQGYVLSPCLFNFYAEYIIRNAGLEETSWNQDCQEKYQ